jgi:heme A synthase
LLLSHIGGAVAVTVVLGGAAMMVLLRHRKVPFLARPAMLALALLGMQLLLGLFAYLTRMASPNDPQPLNPMIAVTVGHVAGGALLFAITIVLTLRTFKVLRAPESAFEMASAH